MSDELGEEEIEVCATANEIQSTYPLATNLSVSGPFEDEDHARGFGHAFIGSLQVIGQHINLTDLDGVTITGTYHETLLQIDRGLEGLRPLTASTIEDGVIGVAMAPAVLRDGLLKTHLIFDVNYVWHIADPESEFFASAVHTIAHECGHVEVHTALDQALPGRILRHRYADYIEQYREEVIDACFQEYGATRLSAGFGLNPIDGYRQTFLTALADTDAAANGFISAYRTHGDIDRVLLEVPPLYANLIKWASYLIGTMHGLGIMVSDQQGLADALSDHWFADYFARLEAAYAELWERLGQWESASEFDGLGDIAIEVLEAGGMFLSRNEEDGIRVDIPFRANNTPNYGLLSLLRGI